MGKILERILELNDKYKELYKLANEYNTYVLLNNMLEQVYHIFNCLTPFATNYHTVTTVDTDYKLIVGHKLWIERYRREMIDEYRKDEFFDVIRKHGDEIARYVRKSIRDEFATLVCLAKRLIPYTKESCCMPINREMIIVDDKDIMKRVNVLMDSLEIDSSVTRYITLIYAQPSDSTLSIDIYELKYTYLLEDIIDIALKAYRNLAERINPIKENNERILKEMINTVLPYKLSKELAS